MCTFRTRTAWVIWRRLSPRLITTKVLDKMGSRSCPNRGRISMVCPISMGACSPRCQSTPRDTRYTISMKGVLGVIMYRPFSMTRWSLKEMVVVSAVSTLMVRSLRCRASLRWLSTLRTPIATRSLLRSTVFYRRIGATRILLTSTHQRDPRKLVITRVTTPPFEKAIRILRGK